MFLRIFNQYIPFRKFYFFLLETLLILIVVLLGTYFRFWLSPGVFWNYENLLVKAVLVVAVIQLSLYYFDLYDFKIFRNNFELAIRLLQALGISSIILAFLYYFFPFLTLGRGIFLSSLGFFILIIFAWRLVYNQVLKTRQLDQKIMVVGCGSLAAGIAGEIMDGLDTGFRIMGFIAEKPQDGGEKLADRPVIGTLSEILEIAQREKVDRVIVAMEERRGNFPTEQLLKCKMCGIKVEDGVDFYEHLTGKLAIEKMRPSVLIFSNGFYKSKLETGAKRIYCFIFSLIGLVLFSPLMLVVSLLVKMNSPGPVFYRQERVGENGHIFTLLKFRSMKENAEDQGPVWAKEKDPRVTSIGRWLRKWRLDEIPQFINIIRGDMDFVGPRPERPFFVESLQKEIPFYSQRHAVKPGVTGWAQIRYPYGASKEDALEKLKYDLYYIKNMSIFFDWIIIFETLKVAIFGKGAR